MSWEQRNEYFCKAQTDMQMIYIEAEREVRQLKAERDKLRELVRDMNKWLWNGADCTECPFTAKCDLNAAFESDLHAHICLGWSEIHDRMHELGIEVSE